MSGKAPKEREHYFIPLEGREACEVEREVYLCWYAGDRQERYQRERDRKNGLCSLENLPKIVYGEDSISCADVFPAPEGSAEDVAIRKLLTEQLYHALGRLRQEDRQLIDRIFFEGVSMRSCAREMGVTHRAVQKRRDSILKNLRELMNFG